MTKSTAAAKLAECLVQANAHIAVMGTDTRVWCESRSSAGHYLDDAECIAVTYGLDRSGIDAAQAAFEAKCPPVRYVA